MTRYSSVFVRLPQRPRPSGQRWPASGPRAMAAAVAIVAMVMIATLGMGTRSAFAQGGPAAALSTPTAPAEPTMPPMPQGPASGVEVPAAATMPGDPGVSVELRRSRIREIVPSDMIEQQAAREYEQIKQEAIVRRALASDQDPQLQRLRAIGKRLLPETLRWNPAAAKWQWEINLIHSNQINAFCMPGGKVAFYSGLIDKLKLTDDEIAMVMGHEISHALEEHARQRAAQAEVTNLGANVMSQLTGFGNLGNMDIGNSARLITLKFSRLEETEADLIGLDMASRAGYDPRASITLWRKMGTMLDPGEEMLSTHPSGRSRIAVLEQHMKEALRLFARAKDMPMEMLPAHETNMTNLGDAPVDEGDDDRMHPLKKPPVAGTTRK
ncbi:putative Zn-dependent protease [Cupriavidus plantarum]|uniref:Peptidase M48-like protein n=2 Tax=Cupriavidus plantarum TaxID=942865 RepID=A0A316FM70_9BURK|nr:M48 family metallopeptidase [Cupriavidus plantarum]NYH97630.1 putative Zn-dependent protease [Cupriavidus plantarum]PWK38770.1 peptidase M48-like protein [Cupriavidus plantarum]REE92399.1 peptidase M48-like protein [Cupriavidus plantarum]CAG2126744.1 Beta-barrel assembly-enhancing protease [Cupriavidus plantarum]SMR67768.1 Peptidase family M48 [Cupriavidus plantarum]